jgi:hypothetical protein
MCLLPKAKFKQVILGSNASPKRTHNMKNISEISQELTTTLSVSEMLVVKGGGVKDDKRRQRPGGGTTTSTPSSFCGN